MSNILNLSILCLLPMFTKLTYNNQQLKDGTGAVLTVNTFLSKVQSKKTHFDLYIFILHLHEDVL